MTAAYDALLASAAPDFVVLVEMQPMEILNSWTAAGGGFTNTYYCTFNSQIQTLIVPGGIYRRLDFVRQNATALTSRASIALVDANLGSYFLDTATNRLYVSTTSGATPDTFALLGAWFTFFFSTTSVSLSGQPLYAPMITGTLPTITDEMPDTLFGAMVSASGPLTLLNTDGLFDRLSKQYVWRNKLVTFKLGGGSLAYSDFATIETLHINSLAINDEVATFQLEDLGNILNKSLPLRTWGDGTVSNPPFGTVGVPQTGIEGQSQPLILGTSFFAPLTLGARIAGVSDSWYAYDFNSGAYGFCQLSPVWAVQRDNKVPTLLTNGVDYTISGAVLTQTNSAYFFETHDIVATITQIGTSPAFFGTMAKAILEICGEVAANIDAAAFTAADTAWPRTLGRYLGEPIAATDLMRELEQSVNGQVYRNSGGQWTCRLLPPDLPASIIELSDVDFVTWEAPSEFATVLNEMRIRWAHFPSTDAWFEKTASDDTTRYANETSDAHRIDTWILEDAFAIAHAHHLRFFRSAPSMTIETEQRGLGLMTARVGDQVSVTRSRAPVARTGSYDGHMLRIVKIEKALGGDVPTVKVWLNDLDGQVDRIFRLASGGSTLTWSTATAQEKARYGFLGDTNRYIDSTDPLTRDGKALW